MLFKRARNRTPAAPCQSCMRIRAFLAISGLLIISLPIFGEKAAPLSKLTPMSIALALIGVGMVAFTARWIAWRRSEASNQKYKSKAVQENE